MEPTQETTPRARTPAQVEASRANGRKYTGGRRADPDDPARYARALERACVEVGLPPPTPGALLACPDCERYSSPADTVRHLTFEHLAVDEGANAARAIPPQRAARIIARSMKRELLAAQKTR